LRASLWSGRHAWFRSLNDVTFEDGERQVGWNFSEKTADHLSGGPSSSGPDENLCSMGSFFQLDLLKK